MRHFQIGLVSLGCVLRMHLLVSGRIFCHEDAYASGNQNLGLESSMSMHHTEMNSQLLRRFKENAGIDELPTEDLQKQLTMTARHQHEVAEKQLQHERAEKQNLAGHVQFGMCVPSN